MSATTYIVLHRDVGGSVSTTASTAWQQLGETQAENATSAVRNLATADGAYVAIPKRSFQQVMVEVETSPRVKIVS